MKRFALKRLTALVLALIMTLSLLPMNVWAEEMQEADDEQVVVTAEETEESPAEVAEEPAEDSSAVVEEPAEEPVVEEEETESSETEDVSASAGISAPLANSAASATEARWGLATGEDADQAPTEWTNGALAEAMTYSNGLPSGTAYIQLLKNVNTTEPLVFDSGKTTILDLNGKTIDRDLEEETSNGQVITVAGNLTLCDSSTTNAENQGKITGGYTHGNGGGVYLYNYGTFTMNGGAISENTAANGEGGGVYVNCGTFTMNGGTISGNAANLGGGVYVTYGTFTMNNGTISKNTATLVGGGVCAVYGTLEMIGGTISENTSSDSGGGVYFASDSGTQKTFTMSGGYISGNTVSSSYAYGGGGVYIAGCTTFTMSGGTISGNTANYGGGVRLRDYQEDIAAMNVSGKPVISGNTAGTDANNIYLASGKIITVNTLSSGANIGVTMEDGSGTFTSGGSSYANKGYFASDAAGYVVVADGSNLKLTEQLSISFNANGGSGTMDNQAITSGVATVLNANTFTRDNYYFSGWNTKTDGTGTAYADKATITVTEGTMLYAQWEVAEARWGLASGTNSDEMPTSWTNGPLAEAMTYANGLESGTAYIQLLSDVNTKEYGALVFASGKTTILDLYSYDIDRGLKEAASEGNVIEIYGTLTLCDTSENASGVITGGVDDSYGGGVYVGEGGTFIMNSGFIVGNTAADPDGDEPLVTCGGGVYVSRGTFTMNGGSISENTACGPGGGVYVDRSTFTMNGGSISENTAPWGGGVYVDEESSFTMYSGFIAGNTATSEGGGVYHRGTFTMNGGTISENTATYVGGGVHVYLDAIFSMKAGSISGNTADYGAGAEVWGSFTMSGGTISGNNATDRGGGVDVRNNGAFTMKGGAIKGNNGKISGGVYLGSDGTMQISGVPIISGNVLNGTLNKTTGLYDNGAASNVYLSISNPITVGSLAAGASIGVTVATSTGEGIFSSGGSSYANKGYFASDAAGYVVVADGSNLKLAEQLSISFNANGGSGTMENQDITSGVATALNANTFTRDNYYFSGWNTKTDGTGTAYADKATITVTEGTMLYAQWEVAEARWGLASGTNSDEMPTSWTNGPLAEAMTYANGLESGTAYIQLLSDVNTNAVGALVFASGKTTILDLYSYDIDRGLKEEMFGGHIVTVNGNLTMCDTSPTAESDPGKLTGGYPMNSIGGGVIVDGGAFTMESGAISGNTAPYSGGVYIENGGTFTMNGGVISENTVSFGGGVYIDDGHFTMNDGTISGNNASSSGGGVYINGYVSSNSFTMYGGYISENTSKYGGGGVAVEDGTFTMYDGEISENTSSNYGGGVGCSGTFVMHDGTISGNTADFGRGGGVDASFGTFTMNGGEITKNEGGGVFAGSNSLFTMNGGIISENNCTGYGGGGVVISSGTFMMIDGTISKNTTDFGGGGVFGGGSFEMRGGAISDNIAEGQAKGGGVYFSGDTFTMSGGVISGNTADVGGGVYCSGDTFAMSGGIISENTSSDGGGVYFSGETFTMNGGAIFGNAAESGGGVCTNGTFTMNGGTISGNSTDFNGGGILNFGSFIMSGGAISENAAAKGGGGVCSLGTFTMTDGTISKNTSDTYGGGVVCSGGTFIMTGGSISENSCTNGGCGVIVMDNGTFTMSNGTISKNIAGKGGGGVAIVNSTFTLSGGVISENVASTRAGGVSIEGIFKVFGTPVISNNKSGTGTAEKIDNVYLWGGRTIDLMDALGNGASIGVTTETSNTAAIIAQGGGNPAYTLTESDAAKFVSDNGYVAELDSTNNSVLMVKPEPPIVGLGTTSGSLNLFQETALTVPVECNYDFVGARFEKPGVDALFDISVGENGTLQITPKDKPEDMTWVEWGKEVAGSYTSAIEIEYIRGEYVSAPETLTIKLTATAPTVKATAVKFNSFIDGDTQPLVLTATNGVVTNVTIDESKENPTWVVLNEDQTVTLINENLDSNTGSGKLNLEVWLEGWRVPAEAVVSVSAAYSAPKLKLKASSVNLVGKAQYQEPVELALLSGDKNFDINKVTNLNVDNDAYVVVYLGGGLFTLDTVEDITSGKINLTAEIDGKPNQTVTVPLTVKVVMPTLKANPTKVTLNTAKGYDVGERDEKAVVFSGDVPESWWSDVTWEITPPKNASADMITVVNNGDGTVTFYANEGIVDGSYKVNVTVGPAKPVAITVTAKATLPKLKLNKSSITLNTAMGDNADVQMVTVTDSDANYDFVLLQEEVTAPDGISAVVGENNAIAVSALTETANGSYKVEIEHKMPGGQSVKSTLTVKVAAKLPTLKPDNKTLSLDKIHGIGTVNVAGIENYSVGELVAEPTVDGITVEMIDRDSFVVTADETLDKKGGKINVYYKLSDAVQTKPVAITVKPVTAIAVTAAVKGNMDVTRPAFDAPDAKLTANFTFKYTGWYPGEYGDMAYEPTLVWEVYAMSGKNKIVGHEAYDFVTGKGSLVASSDDNNGGWFCDVDDTDYGVALALNTDENSAWKNGEVNPKYAYNVYVKLVFADGTEVACKSVKLTVKQGSTKFAADTKAVTVEKAQDALSEAFVINGTDKDKVNVADIAMVAVAANKKPSAFAVVESGDGYAIKVIDPTIAKNGTVKVNIWLEGNYVDGCEEIWDTKNLEYRKPNATVSLKVTVR